MIVLVLEPASDVPAKTVAFEGEVVVGRDPRCQIESAAVGVCNPHCRFVQGPGSWFVEDLGSSSGTFVDGVRIAGPRQVRARSVVTVGQLRLRVLQAVAPVEEVERPVSPALSEIALAAPAPAVGAEQSPPLTTAREHFDFYERRARAWLTAGRPASALLRGPELVRALAWLKVGRDLSPSPQPLHRDYILASKRAEPRRGRKIALSILVATLGLGVAGWTVGASSRFWSVGSPGEPRTDVLAPDERGSEEPERKAISVDLASLMAQVESLPEPRERIALYGAFARLASEQGVTPFSDAWWLLHERAQSDLARVRGHVLRGHEGPVTALAVDPTGRWVVSGGRDHGVNLWDLREPTPSLPRALRGHLAPVTVVGISPDGRWLVTASEDHGLRRWDLESSDPGASGVPMRGHEGAVSALVFDVARQRVLTGDEQGSIWAWKLDVDGAPESSFRIPAHDGPVRVLVAENDSVWSGGEDGRIRGWRARDGRSISSGGVMQHDAPATALAVSSSGRWLVSADEQGKLIARDRRSRSRWSESFVLEGHRERVSSIAISPDERHLVSAGHDDTLRVWRLDAPDPGADSIVLSGHRGDITGLRFLGRGHKVASAGRDNQILVWDVRSADRVVERHALEGHEGPVTALASSLDALTLVSGSADGTIRVWDPLSARGGMGARILRGVDGVLSDAELDRDGERLVVAAGSGELLVWDLTQASRTVAPSRLAGGQGALHDLALDPMGRWIAAGGESGEIYVWPAWADDGALPRHVLRHHRGAVNRLEFTSDGTRLVSTGSDRAVVVWSSSSMDPQWVGIQTDEVHALALSKDRLAFTGGLDGSLFRWNLQGPTGEPVSMPGHDGEIDVLTVDPKGRWLVSAGADRKIRLWSVEHDRPPMVLRGHEEGVSTAAFSKSGRYLATAGRDRAVLLWNLIAQHPEESIVRLDGASQSITSVTFVDEEHVAAASNDGNVYLWNTITGRAVSLEGHDGVVKGVLEATSMGLVASYGYDGTARLWPISSSALARLACDVVGRPVDYERWVGLRGEPEYVGWCEP